MLIEIPKTPVEELKEFKTLILSKLKEAQDDYSLLIGSLSHNDDHGTNDN